MAKTSVSLAGAPSAAKAARLLEIAAKVRQVPGSFKEGAPDLLHKGWIALGRLIREAYEAGAWQREGSQIGDRLRLALTSVGRDRSEWLAGETVPVWVLDAWGAVVGTLTSHLTPFAGEKESVEFEAGILGDEIEREAAWDFQEDWMYMPAKEIETIFFAGNATRRKRFLRKHPEVRTRRPLTEDGTPHSRRLNINVLGFLEALRRDEYYANNPLVWKQIERNMKRAEVNEKLLDATLPFFGIKSPAKVPQRST
jgi:hypothetical protein